MREGIHKEDNRRIQESKNNAPITELVKDLLTPIKQMIEEGMRCARRYDLFLNNTINNKNDIVDGIVEELSTVFRKTISTNSIALERIKNFGDKTQGQLLYDIKRVAGMHGWTFVRKDTRSAMYTATKCKYNDMTLRNIEAVQYLDGLIWHKCEKRMKEILVSLYTKA